MGKDRQGHESGDREPALSLTSTIHAKCASLITVFGPAGYQVTLDEPALRLRTSEIESLVVIAEGQAPHAVSWASLRGATVEDLLVTA